MQKTYHVIDLIQKIVDNSFFVNGLRVVSGELFGYKDKYFHLNDVIKGILELIEINNSWTIDIDQLYDIMYTKGIEDPTILKQKVF
jgi:hypothetical protein